MITLDKEITQMAAALEEKTIKRRRDFHHHAEAGWTEYRTASIVADTLDKLGYQVLVGDEVLNADFMMGKPSEEALAKHKERAIAQGAVRPWVDRMDGGKTAVVGVMKFSEDGPTVGFRADMDANDVTESTDENHRPYKEGFSSVNPEAHHGCGHDGHTAMLLSVAEILVSLKDRLRGTVKLIFQPAEEGLRGARPIAESGILDDIDYLLGMHLGATNAKKLGLLGCEVRGWQASTKFDVKFTGVSAHAAGDTENGRDALLAAATALIGIHALPRHSKGVSKVHVGVLHGGTGRNVVADSAFLKAETRGETSEINDYTYQCAVNAVNAAAQMYGVKAEITECGYASGYKTDADFVDFVRPVAEDLGLFEILPYGISNGSEDYTTMMERVQRHGGKSTFFRLGTDFYGLAHNPRFDFNEKALAMGVRLTASALTETLLKKA